MAIITRVAIKLHISCNCVRFPHKSPWHVFAIATKQGYICITQINKNFHQCAEKKVMKCEIVQPVSNSFTVLGTRVGCRGLFLETCTQCRWRGRGIACEFFFLHDCEEVTIASLVQEAGFCLQWLVQPILDNYCIVCMDFLMFLLVHVLCTCDVMSIVYKSLSVRFYQFFSSNVVLYE